MKFVFALVVLGGIVFPPAAHAVSWFPVGTDGSHSQWSYDADNIQRFGNAASIRVEIKRTNGDVGLVQLVMWCNRGEYTTINGAEYDEGGNPVRAYRPVPDADSGMPLIIPQEIRTRLSQTACR